MTNSDIIRSREELLTFFGGLDAKRPNAWAQYGYKQALTFEDFQLAYDRGGAGFGVVHRHPRWLRAKAAPHQAARSRQADAVGDQDPEGAQGDQRLGEDARPRPPEYGLAVFGADLPHGRQPAVEPAPGHRDTAGGPGARLREPDKCDEMG